MAATDNDPVDAESKIMLADMRGDIRLINDRHSRYTDDVKRIEERHLQDVKRIDERLHTHGNRIGSLEAKDYLKTGERAGFSMSLKLLWGLCGGSIIAIAAVVARQLGV